MPCSNTNIRPYLFSDGLHLGRGRLKAGNKAWQDGSFVFAVRKPGLTSKTFSSDGLPLPRGRLKLQYRLFRRPPHPYCLFNRLQSRQYGVPDGEDLGFAAARPFLPFAQAFEEDVQTGHSIVLQLFGFVRHGISLKHQVGCNQREMLYFYFNRVFLKTVSDKK